MTIGTDEINDSKKLYFILKSHLENKIPLAIGKIGANELNFIYYEFYLQNEQKFDKIKEIYTFNLTTGAGCYPYDYTYLLSFIKDEYISILNDIDIFAKWNSNKVFEENLINKYCPIHLGVKLGSLEPYYFTEYQWSHLLKDKKVLIISPFVDSIIEQYKKKDLIWNNLLPDFTLIPLKFPLSYYLVNEIERDNYPKNSHELLNNYKKKIDEIDFDIALIGIGIYGLPLAKYCKSKKKIGFHLGGALQVLFGIKGKRWKELPYVNEHWIYPSNIETPKYNSLCEDGCYW